MLGGAVQLVAIGLFVGGLARWAVPGPDPMPVWFTVVLGLVGSAIGGGIAAAIFGHDAVFWFLLFGVAASALLVVAYRRFVQRRPITGPDAYRLPTRGVGIARMRARLQKLGIDPNALGRDPERIAQLRNLRRLRDEGALTQQEYEERVRNLDESS